MKGIKRTVAAFVFAALAVGSVSALDAKVISVSGKVEVQKSGSSTWTPLKSGDTVSKGSIISTGFKSSAEIQIDGSKVSLEPLTRITIEKLASGSAKDEASLYLNSGKVNADVKKTSGKKVDFKVSSPVATASVRGTVFSFNARGDLTTREGLVSKGPGVPRANVSDSDETGDFVPADGESSVTTSTEKVSGKREIPVAAGQSSSGDTVTGRSGNPQREKAGASMGPRGDGTSSLASKEAGKTQAGQGPAFGGSVDKKSGTVIISISIED